MNILSDGKPIVVGNIKGVAQMREIKFRGQSDGTWEERGKWLYGDLVHIGSGLSICSRIHGGYQNISVIPKTVSQYTGAKDSNGKKIYEGDIIHCYDGRCRIVEWVQDNGSWELQMLPNGDYIDPLFFGKFEVGEWVVIGNRWDNPELLGGARK